MMAKACPMCRMKLGSPGGLIADQDDAGQFFSFAFCLPCSNKFRRWSPSIRQQQIRAAIGLLSMNPQRYEVRFFDSKAAAWLYIELETKAIGSKA
jgi:hypothetical protein